MYIYNANKNKPQKYAILDPDFNYHNKRNEDQLYSFFKSLKIPSEVETITGIYIQYQITPYLYETHPYIYARFYTEILEQIQQHLDFGHANLFHEESNYFFMILFDVTEEEVCQAYLKIYQKINGNQFTYQKKKCRYKIKCGAYFSHKFINPYDLLQGTFDQLRHALQKEETMISLYNILDLE